MPIELPKLDTIERTSLRNHEKTIAKDEEAFIRVGTALMAIRDGNLYRETNKSFGAYCKERWEFSRDFAYKQIAAAEVMGMLESVDHGIQLPTNERQARPLTTINLEQVGDAWQTVVETAPKDDDGIPIITGKHVQKTVDQLGAPSDPKKPAKKKPAKKPDYGKCPNCAGTKWTKDDDGVICAKCQHPHGEATGGPDEDRVKTQKSKTVKTTEALMRAFGDLQTMKARLEHDEAIRLCKRLLEIAKGWR